MLLTCRHHRAVALVIRAMQLASASGETRPLLGPFHTWPSGPEMALSCPPLTPASLSVRWPLATNHNRTLPLAVPNGLAWEKSPRSRDAYVQYMTRDWKIAPGDATPNLLIRVKAADAVDLEPVRERRSPSWGPGLMHPQALASRLQCNTTADAVGLSLTKFPSFDDASVVAVTMGPRCAERSTSQSRARVRAAQLRLRSTDDGTLRSTP